MSYQMNISERSRKAGRFVSRVHKAIQEAVARSGMKQQEIAQKLEMDRSAVNRRILGQSNLTLRTIADLAWALDHDIKFELVPASGELRANRPTRPLPPREIIVSAVTDNVAAKPLPSEAGATTKNRTEMTYAG